MSGWIYLSNIDMDSKSVTINGNRENYGDYLHLDKNCIH